MKFIYLFALFFLCAEGQRRTQSNENVEQPIRMGRGRTRFSPPPDVVRNAEESNRRITSRRRTDIVNPERRTDVVIPERRVDPVVSERRIDAIVPERRSQLHPANNRNYEVEESVDEVPSEPFKKVPAPRVLTESHFESQTAPKKLSTDQAPKESGPVDTIENDIPNLTYADITEEISSPVKGNQRSESVSATTPEILPSVKDHSKNTLPKNDNDIRRDIIRNYVGVASRVEKPLETQRESPRRSQFRTRTHTSQAAEAGPTPASRVRVRARPTRRPVDVQSTAELESAAPTYVRVVNRGPRKRIEVPPRATTPLPRRGGPSVFTAEDSPVTRSRTGRKIVGNARSSEEPQRIDIDINASVTPRYSKRRIQAEASTTEINSRNSRRKTLSRVKQSEVITPRFAPSISRNRIRGRKPIDIDEQKLEVLPLFESEAKIVDDRRSPTRAPSRSRFTHVDSIETSATENEIKVLKPIENEIADYPKATTVTVSQKKTVNVESSFRRKPFRRPVIKESVVSKITEVTSKRTIGRRPTKGSIATSDNDKIVRVREPKVSVSQVVSRSSKSNKHKLRNHSGGLTSSEEDISDSDNYPAPFKALIHSKKITKESRPLASSSVTKSSRAVVIPSLTPISSVAATSPSVEENREDEELQNELIPKSSTTPLPIRPTRKRFSPITKHPDNIKGRKVPPTRKLSIRSTTSSPVTTKENNIGFNKDHRFHAKFSLAQKNEAAPVSPSTKVPFKSAKGLYSSRKTKDLERNSHNRTSKNLVEVTSGSGQGYVIPPKKSNRFSSRYRTKLPSRPATRTTTGSPVYLPTIPTYRNFATSVKTEVGDNDLGLEIISFDDPVNTVASANLVSGEYQSSSTETNVSSLNSLDSKNTKTTEKSISIIERIINSITAISTTPEPLGISPTSTTTLEPTKSSAILKLATKKSTKSDKTKDSTQVTKTLTSKPHSITSEKPTTVIQRILDSLSAIQSETTTDNQYLNTKQVGNNFNTLNSEATTPLSIVTELTTSSSLPKLSSTSINPLSVLDEISDDTVLQKRTIGKLLDILNSLTTEASDTTKLVVVTPKSSNFIHNTLSLVSSIDGTSSTPTYIEQAQAATSPMNSLELFTSAPVFDVPEGKVITSNKLPESTTTKMLEIIGLDSFISEAVGTITPSPLSSQAEDSASTGPPQTDNSTPPPSTDVAPSSQTDNSTGDLSTNAPPLENISQNSTPALSATIIKFSSKYSSSDPQSQINRQNSSTDSPSTSQPEIEQNSSIPDSSTSPQTEKLVLNSSTDASSISQTEIAPPNSSTEVVNPSTDPSTISQNESTPQQSSTDTSTISQTESVPQSSSVIASATDSTPVVQTESISKHVTTDNANVSQTTIASQANTVDSTMINNSTESTLSMAQPTVTVTTEGLPTTQNPTLSTTSDAQPNSGTTTLYTSSELTNKDKVFSLPSILPTLPYFSVSPESVSVFSANDLLFNSLSPEDFVTSTVTILSKNNIPDSVATSESTTTDSSTESSTTMLTTSMLSAVENSTEPVVVTTITSNVSENASSNVTSVSNSSVKNSSSNTTEEKRSGRLLDVVNDLVSNNIETSSAAPDRDYFIFAILPNNTILRKRPDPFPNNDTPFLIVGVFPNNTIVRKFPNGSLVPMEPVIRVRGFDTRENPPPLPDITSNQVTPDQGNQMDNTNLQTVDNQQNLLPSGTLNPTTPGLATTESVVTTTVSNVGDTGTTIIPTITNVIETDASTVSNVQTSDGPNESTTLPTVVPDSTSATVLTTSTARPYTSILPSLVELFNGNTLEAFNKIVNNTSNQELLELSPKTSEVISIDQFLLQQKVNHDWKYFPARDYDDKIEDNTISSNREGMSLTSNEIVMTTTVPTMETTQQTTPVIATSTETTTKIVTTTSRPITTTYVPSFFNTIFSTLQSIGSTIAPPIFYSTRSPPLTATIEPFMAQSTENNLIYTTADTDSTYKTSRISLRDRGSFSTTDSTTASVTTSIPNEKPDVTTTTGMPTIATTTSLATTTTSRPTTTTQPLTTTTPASTTTTTTEPPTTTTGRPVTTTMKAVTTTTMRPITTTIPPQILTTTLLSTTIPLTTPLSTSVPLNSRDPTIVLSVTDTPYTSAALSSTVKSKRLTEQQKKDLETLAELEREQAAILKQLAFLTSLNLNPQKSSKDSNNLAHRIVALASDRDKNRITRTTTGAPIVKVTSKPKVIASGDPQIDDLIRTLNQNAITPTVDLTSTYGSSNDALLAALLKERGIEPTTPKSLADTIRQAGVFTQTVSATLPTTRKPKPRTTTPRQPGPLMQRLNWLLNAIAPPPPPARKPKAAKPTRPPVVDKEELLTNLPTHITPVVTAPPSKLTSGKNSLSQDDIQKLIKQLEALQKDPTSGKDLDLSSIRSLQNLNGGVQVITPGSHGATARATTRSPEDFPAIISNKPRPTRTTTSTPSTVSNSIDDDYIEEVSTAKPVISLPPVKLRPVAGIDENADPLIRGRLVTAAVNVTRAISSFLGSALQDAAHQISHALSSGSGSVRDYFAGSSFLPNIGGSSAIRSPNA